MASIIIQTGGWGRDPYTRAVYVVVTAVYALNIIYLLVLNRLGDSRSFTAFQIAADVVIIGLLVFLTGGVRSQLVVLYPLWILGSALLLSRRAAALTAAESAFVHVAASALAVARLEALSPDLTADLSRLFMQLFAFPAMAFLAGLLSHRLSVARLLSRDILETIGRGIVVTDASGTVLFSNREAQRLLAPGLVSGRPLDDALPKDIRSVLPAAGEGVPVRMELALPSGGEVPVSVELKPVTADSGRILGKLLVLTDRSLEKRVEEASLQAQRSEAIRAMAGTLAHEIRNPLAVVRSSVEEIMGRLKENRGNLDPDTESLAQIVLSESDRLDSILSDFLEFAKMRPTRRVSCDLAEVVHRAALVLERSGMLFEKGAMPKILVECDGPLPYRGDPEQLRQTLLNLGLNSLDALAGSHEGVVSMRARRLPSGDGMVLEVEDNGCGMSEEVRRRAFEPFFTSKARGTGLGLAIVERVIRAHGGWVRLQSEPGVGTRVEMRLPAEEAARETG